MKNKNYNAIGPFTVKDISDEDIKNIGEEPEIYEWFFSDGTKITTDSIEAGVSAIRKKTGL